MDEVLFDRILRSISIVAGTIGVLFGADLIFGAKIIKSLKKILDRGTDVIDKSLVNHGKKFFGVIILVLSLLILFLVRRATM